MTVTIDEYGRLVIPKKVRDRLGLNPGTELELEQSDDTIQLKPVHPEDFCTYEDGIPVYTGPLPENFDVVEEIKRQREERTRKILGQ